MNNAPEEIPRSDGAVTVDELAHAIDNSTPYPVELDTTVCRYMAERLLEMVTVAKRTEHDVWQPEEPPPTGPEPSDPNELTPQDKQDHGPHTETTYVDDRVLQITHWKVGKPTSQPPAGLREWLTANGIPLKSVPLDEHNLRIEERDGQRFICYTGFVLTDTGRPQLDPRDSESVWMREASTPCLVEPPARLGVPGANPDAAAAGRAD